MRRLASHALTILAIVGLTAWATPPTEAAVAHAKIRCGPPDVPNGALRESIPQVDGGPPPSVDPEGDEGKIQPPPGRQDPNEFYKKSPRKPRRLLHFYA